MTKTRSVRAAPLALAVAAAAALAGCAATGPGAGGGTATIQRTAHGVAHVSAGDLETLAYGIAYAHAQDNVCQTADQLVTVRGERSRHFGGATLGLLGLRALPNEQVDLFIASHVDDAKLALRLSRRVKDRALFRPYALSVAAEDATRVLDIAPDRLRDYRWMQHAAAVRPDMRAKVIAATHVDGTTRPQVCHADDNPRFHALLTAVGEAWGVAAVLNTSFNPAGYPMVSTPTEALAMFARTDMDALVLEDTVIWKEAP